MIEKIVRRGDLENFINALLSSAADLIQGDSGVRCDLGVSLVT